MCQKKKIEGHWASKRVEMWIAGEIRPPGVKAYPCLYFFVSAHAWCTVYDTTWRCCMKFMHRKDTQTVAIGENILKWTMPT